MRITASTTATAAILTAVMALAGVFATPSYADGNGFQNWWNQLEQKYGDCSWHYGIKCKKTNIIAPHDPSSTELFVSRCNGEVGWWTEVKFQDGSSLCIARSTADFYHNDGSLGATTCTKTKIWFWDGVHKYQKTVSGACPVHMSKPE